MIYYQVYGVFRTFVGPNFRMIHCLSVRRFRTFCEDKVIYSYVMIYCLGVRSFPNAFVRPLAGYWGLWRGTTNLRSYYEGYHMISCLRVRSFPTVCKVPRYRMVWLTVEGADFAGCLQSPKVSYYLIYCLRVRKFPTVCALRGVDDCGGLGDRW